MRTMFFAGLLLWSGIAAARPLEPVTPLRSQAPARAKGEHSRLRPIESVVWPVDRARQNVGASGRINATRDEAQTAETPELQPAPFSGSLF